MFKSNRVHYFVECFQKISSSGYSSEAYNYYQVICLLHSITSIIIFNCRALHCTAFVSHPSSRYGLNNVERDVKHQIVIISSSISLKTSTYIPTHFNYFNAYSVLFGKIKLRFFFILTLQIYVFVRRSIRATYTFISVDSYLEISTYYLEIST